MANLYRTTRGEYESLAEFSKPRRFSAVSHPGIKIPKRPNAGGGMRLKKLASPIKVKRAPGRRRPVQFSGSTPRIKGAYPKPRYGTIRALFPESRDKVSSGIGKVRVRFHSPTIASSDDMGYRRYYRKRGKKWTATKHGGDTF